MSLSFCVALGVMYALGFDKKEECMESKKVD